MIARKTEKMIILFKNDKTWYWYYEIKVLFRVFASWCNDFGTMVGLKIWEKNMRKPVARLGRKHVATSIKKMEI